MNTMKKTLTVCVCLILVAALAIGGTVAYLTVEPQNENNVFSVGDIAIDLNEEVSVDGAGEVEQTEEGATYTGVMPGDYLQKEVTVTNTGSNPAYVAVTVTMNNADFINNAIDEVYEAKGYSAEEVQAMYDYIFDGWGVNYSKVDANGEALGMRLTITGEDMPEGVMQVDSVKTIDEYWQVYNKNWFSNEGDVDKIIPFDGYYTTGMDKYQLRWTYYMLLEKEGDSVTLFKGLNVPAEFTAEQLKMFEDLCINIDLAAIQADNIPGEGEEKAKKAFELLKDQSSASYIKKVSTADELADALAEGGYVVVVNDITVDEPLRISNDVTLTTVDGVTLSSSTDSYLLYVEGDGKLNIIGGNYNGDAGEANGWKSIILAKDNAEVVIEDGYFDGGEGDSFNASVWTTDNAVATIKGGNFVCGADVDNASGTILYAAGSDSTINIEGGTFKNAGDYYWGYTWLMNVQDNTNSKIVVTGGTFFDCDPSNNWPSNGDCVPDGYNVVSEKKDNGDMWYTVVNTTVVSTADELADAIAEGGYVVLGDNIDYDGSSIEISEGVEVTLDLSGHTLTNAVSGAPALKNSGTLTITGDGTIVNGTNNTRASHTIENLGTLIVENGTIGTDDTAGAAIVNAGTAIINGGNFSSKQENTRGDGLCAYVFINNGGTMTINNAVVNGQTHGLFGAYAGEIIVGGGSYTLDGNGGLGCYVVYATGEGKVTLNGGTINTDEPRSNRVFFVYDNGNYFNADAVATGKVVVNGATIYLNGVEQTY